MSNELHIAYKLYAMEINRENIQAANAMRFCRITPFYILIYTHEDAPKNAIEVTQTETHRLTDNDEQWLLDCNLVILAEEAKKREVEIAADMKSRLERLEKALENEAENLKEGDGT